MRRWASSLTLGTSAMLVKCVLDLAWGRPGRCQTRTTVGCRFWPIRRDAYLDGRPRHRHSANDIDARSSHALSEQPGCERECSVTTTPTCFVQASDGPDNARASLRAHPTKCERSELRKVLVGLSVRYAAPRTVGRWRASATAFGLPSRHAQQGRGRDHPVCGGPAPSSEGWPPLTPIISAKSSCD